MNKRRGIFRIFLVLVISIIFYLVLIFVTNHTVENQQEHALSQHAANFALIADQPEALTKWSKNNDLTVIEHPLQKGSSFQNTARDIVNHNLVTRGDPITQQTVNQKVYLVYALFTGLQTPVIFFMPKLNVWEIAPTAFWFFSILYFVLVLISLWIVDRRFGKLSETLATLVENLHRIRHRENPEPIILDGKSSLYPLSDEINKLEISVEQMRESISVRSESFRRLIDHLPLGVMLIDEEDGDVRMMNTAMRDLLQAEAAPLPHPFIDDVKTYRLSQMIEHTIRSHANHHGEVQLVQQPVRYVDANVIQVGEDSPRPQILVLLYDLTDMRRIEQMQLDFVGNVSHELKTPVTSIAGFAETLMSKKDMKAEDRDNFIHIIYKESQRLSQLIEDILELARLDEDATGNKRIINVKDEVKNILEEYKPAIESENLQVDVNGKTDINISMNQADFDQIIKNLISNAIHYNKSEGKIAINIAQGKHNLHLSVADTGIGLTEAEQERIFERFYRVDKARSYNNGGTGLGLAIVKEIVQNHGGSVSVTSQYGVGSTFNVKLPKA